MDTRQINNDINNDMDCSVWKDLDVLPHVLWDIISEYVWPPFTNALDGAILFVMDVCRLIQQTKNNSHAFYKHCKRGQTLLRVVEVEERKVGVLFLTEILFTLWRRWVLIFRHKIVPFSMHSCESEGKLYRQMKQYDSHDSHLATYMELWSDDLHMTPGDHEDDALECFQRELPFVVVWLKHEWEWLTIEKDLPEWPCLNYMEAKREIQSRGGVWMRPSKSSEEYQLWRIAFSYACHRYIYTAKYYIKQPQGFHQHFGGYMGTIFLCQV